MSKMEESERIYRENKGRQSKIKVVWRRVNDD